MNAVGAFAPFPFHPRRNEHITSSSITLLDVTPDDFQDGARVCSFLAKGNVKTLGDSRLSLTRSLKNLEQLDVRMDGTAAGFARNFGTGLHR